MRPPRPSVPAIPHGDLEDCVRQAVGEDEPVFYARTPARRAGGHFVWLIAGLGVVFSFGAQAALRETWGLWIVRPPQPWWIDLLSLALFGLEAAFAAFSGLLLLWPALSDWHRRTTRVVVTDRAVYRLRVRRGKLVACHATALTACDAVSLARRRTVGRGPRQIVTHTLVLNETVKERPFDGRSIYRWSALHGLPDAEQAADAIEQGRARIFAEAAAPFIDEMRR